MKIEKIDNGKNINTNLEIRENQTMQTKTFKADIEIKTIEDSVDAPHGSFTALVSVFNNVDLVNDRILPGAFADSLASYQASGKTLPIVWSHDWSNADSFIGKTLSAVETPEGLLVNAAFFNTPKAQHIRELLAERVVSEFSFAYDIVDQQKGTDGVNELLKLNILEAGPTLKGANPDTQLLVAKAITAVADIEDAKAGRALSTKNESKIKDAMNLLNEVVSSLDNNSDNAKSEDAEMHKVEEHILDANLAISLLEIEDLDTNN
jgi:HK97 family phage prohead protease